MGLFVKKDPCAICGGTVKGLLPHKIEKQLICRDCYGTVDLPDEVSGNMTLRGFKEYMAFREQNNLLKEHFLVTHEIDFGIFEPKFVIDSQNRFFCMDRELEKTVFSGNDIVSFIIREDAAPLFDGSPLGLTGYTSSVPDRIMALAPEIRRINMQRDLQNAANTFGGGRNSRQNSEQYTQHIEIPKPFTKFIIEIRLRHPYWNVITAEVSAPHINSERPDLDEYLRQYTNSALLMEQLASALMGIAFSDEQSQPAKANTASEKPDIVNEIRRFKELADQGIITEEEFAAKKRQLLGI